MRQRFLRVLVWILIFFMGSGPGVCGKGPRSAQYTVKKGDTLWGISQSLYGNSLYWPFIWDSNQDKVPNPHWIYPGEVLLVPHPAQVKYLTKPTVHGVAVKRRPLVPSGVILFSSYLSPRPVFSPYTLGTSVYDPDKTIFNQYDRVSIYWRTGVAPCKVGERYLIVRNDGKVKMPNTRKAIGWQVDCLGVLQVDKVGKEKAQGTIRTVAFPVRKGDFLLPLKALPPIYRFIPGPPDRHGVIVKLQGEKNVGALMDFVMVNLGTRDGLRPGMVLDVYSPAGVDEVVGRLVVIRVQERVSTCYLYNSKMPLEPGMEVRGGKVGAVTSKPTPPP